MTVNEEFHRRGAGRDVVFVMVQGAKGDPRAVVQLNASGRARDLLDFDFLKPADKADFMQGFLVRLGPIPTFGGTRKVVESHARADDVEHGSPFVSQGSFQKREKLLAISRERASNVCRAAGDRFEAEVERRDGIFLAGFAAEV